jgi:hypothetical protein
MPFHRSNSGTNVLCAATTRVWWLTLLLLAQYGTMTPAQAFEFCVGTAVELNTALTVATTQDGQTTVIKLQQGRYHLGGSVLYEAGAQFNAVQLLGGYNDDCTLRTLAPDNTVLDGDAYAGEVGFWMAGDLLVEGIDFTDFASGHGVDFDVSQAPQVDLRNNIFEAVPVFIDGKSTVHVRNNLFFGSSEGALGIESPASVELTSNTFADNAGGGVRIDVPVNPDGSEARPVRMTNNVCWNNGGFGNNDLAVIILGTWGDAPAPAVSQSNLYQTYRFVADTFSGGDIIGSDPLFESPAAGDYRLLSASPAVNSGGPANLTSVDLDGNPRVVGSAIDRGAYEANVNDTVPQTITVTNANDSGAGSLRQAITDVNANSNPDANYIHFNIAQACPVIISPASNLPALTHDVHIDGFTQPGSAPNTLITGDNATRCIVLNGGGTLGNGLSFGGTSASQYVVQGLVFEGYANAAINIGDGTGDVVAGNQFGGRIGSLALAANHNDISILSRASGALIGGYAASQRNVIGGATGYGITTGSTGSGAGNHSIIGNLIGVNGDEVVAAGNAVGIRLVNGGNEVAQNVIVNSGGNGIEISGAGAQDNEVLFNRIGRLDSRCITLPAPVCFNDVAANAANGVRIDGGAGNSVVEFNTIWYNAQSGISVGDISQGNLLGSNSVYTNGGYGIDLDGSGLNDNDADPGAASLPNRGLNFPTITRAYGGIYTGSIEGVLDSTNGAYLIQAFSSAAADNEGTGEGEVFIGDADATIVDATSDQDGRATFVVAVSSPGVSLAGRKITLTATDSLGNTSEFSFRADYQCDRTFASGFDDLHVDACPTP